MGLHHLTSFQEVLTQVNSPLCGKQRCNVYTYLNLLPWLSSQPWFFEDLKLTLLLENICKQVTQNFNAVLSFCSSGSSLYNHWPLGQLPTSSALHAADRNASAPTVTSSKRPPERNSYSEEMEVAWRYFSIVSTAAPSMLQRAGLESGRWGHFPMSWEALHSCLGCMAGRGPWQHSKQNWNPPSMCLPTGETLWYFWNFPKIQSPNCLSLKARARRMLCRRDLEYWI